MNLNSVGWHICLTIHLTTVHCKTCGSTGGRKARARNGASWCVRHQGCAPTVPHCCSRRERAHAVFVSHYIPSPVRTVCSTPVISARVVGVSVLSGSSCRICGVLWGSLFGRLWLNPALIYLLVKPPYCM